VSKWHNIPRRVDGILFQSQKESYRYVVLKAMAASGDVSDLELQVRFKLDVKGVHICDYIADFVYEDNVRKCHVVEDVKGARTEIFKLKKRLMLAVHGIDVEET
jgi:hypothetical protein